MRALLQLSHDLATGNREMHRVQVWLLLMHPLPQPSQRAAHVSAEHNRRLLGALGGIPALALVLHFAGQHAHGLVVPRQLLVRAGTPHRCKGVRACWEGSSTHEGSPTHHQVSLMNQLRAPLSEVQLDDSLLESVNAAAWHRAYTRVDAP